MRTQTLFVIVSAIAGALAAPIQARDPKMLTVYENVVHVVTATSTVWVKPSPTYKPEAALPTYPTTTSPPFKYAPNPATTYSPPPPAATNIHHAPKPKPKPKPKWTTNYAAPPPATTPTYVAPPATSSPAPPEVSVSSTGGNYGGSPGGGSSGVATFYTTGTGSCGKVSQDSDHIVAISYVLMNAKSTGNPNNNPYCGQQIEVSRGGKSVVCTVVDTCEGCTPEHLDLSPSAFDMLGQPAEGLIPITYKWVN
jgi:hypothetical protein